MMLSRIFLLALLALPATAAWQRHVLTPKGDRFDAPEPHPLAYFTQYPMLREESGDFCYLCSPEKRLAEAKKVKVTTELKLVGTIAGFEISDLFYRFQCDGCIDWKMLPIIRKRLFLSIIRQGVGRPAGI